jgi:hypothetical protein
MLTEENPLGGVCAIASKPKKQLKLHIRKVYFENKLNI